MVFSVIMDEKDIGNGGGDTRVWKSGTPIVCVTEVPLGEILGYEHYLLSITAKYKGHSHCDHIIQINKRSTCFFAR